MAHAGGQRCASFCFNPFQGFIRISTKKCRPCSMSAKAFQSLSGIYQDFYVAAIQANRPESVLFQSLSGIYQDFYLMPAAKIYCNSCRFQSLSGIYQDFYAICKEQSPASSEVSIPFRDLLGFLRPGNASPSPGKASFNPFQGFIRISTIQEMAYREDQETCFNPFQGFIRISTQCQHTESNIHRKCFNPFQGFIRISTKNTCSCVKLTLMFQSLSGIYQDFYDCPVRLLARELQSFQSLSGIYQDFYAKLQPCLSKICRFQSLSGIYQDFYIGGGGAKAKSQAQFQSLSGIYQDFYSAARRGQVCFACFNPFQGFIRISTDE